MTREELLQDIADNEKNVANARQDIKDAEVWLAKQVQWLADSYKALLDYDKDHALQTN